MLTSCSSLSTIMETCNTEQCTGKLKRDKGGKDKGGDEGGGWDREDRQSVGMEGSSIVMQRE